MRDGLAPDAERSAGGGICDDLVSLGGINPPHATAGQVDDDFPSASEANS
jgi:hypothetical protein